MERLADYIAGIHDPEAALEAFVSWNEQRGRRLYPAQEEAILEAFAGNNVIVATPTGSGKSLVALGAHVAALATGRRSWYTAPIKALVSEKFFELSAELGRERVGMITGDASINPDAPVICATAEIVANLALRDGPEAPVGQVVMDEFHFYSDPDRGWAWQVPLLELNRTQFLLMSATLGNVDRFVRDLEHRTGRDTVHVTSATRPIPLDYRYSRTAIQRTIEDVLAAGEAPIYVVHPTQAGAAAAAQALTSINVATRAQRDEIAEVIGEFRFNPGFGKALSRFVRAGIGVHHAGMLPRYRRLVERLTQAGLLKVICGTDTLGVGINVPIRTVVMTSLSKYDGQSTRLLSAREFHQIAGRAGRAGYDTEGTVVVQAPEHVIENERALKKAGDDPKKRRKVVRAKPRAGEISWTEETFDRLVKAPPEPLVSSFRVSHGMLLNVLDRPGDGCAALKRLLTDNHEPRAAQRTHIRRAIAMFRTLVASGAVERLDAPDSQGRRVRVTVDLQADFALDHPLSPFVLDALPKLASLTEPARAAESGEAAGAETRAFDVVSLVESTLEDPSQILSAQLKKARSEAIAEMKADGVEYEERMEKLEQIEYPKPLREFLYDNFDRYRVEHPWAADFNIKPKSVLRDMCEEAMGFSEYVAHYGLARSEGLVLRYLSDAYRALVRSVPEDDKTDELLDLTEWLGELVRQTDSSLLDEWEKLAHPDDATSQTEGSTAGALDAGKGSTAGALDAGKGSTAIVSERPPPPVTQNERAFRLMVRNAAFRRIELLSRKAWDSLADLDGQWTAERWEQESADYFSVHSEIGIGSVARSPGFFQVTPMPDSDPALGRSGRVWTVRQVLDDPEEDHDWALVLEVDLDASDEAGGPVITPRRVYDSLTS